MPRGQGMQRIAIADRAKEIVRRRGTRRELIEKCGEKAFLDPVNLKFPVVNPLTGDCKPDCKLLYAAYLRANEWHYNDIAAKAKSLYDSNGCAEKTGVKIHEEGKK